MKKCSSCLIEKPTGEFYSGPRCKECVKASARVWYAENKDRAKKNVAAYAQKHPEKTKKWQRDYYWRDVKLRRAKSNEWARANPEKRRISRENWNNANRERIARVSSVWMKSNREKAAAAWARYNAAKLMAIPKWANQFFIAEAYDLAKRRTALRSGGHKWHVDHIVPLISKKVCGLHVEHNLQVIPDSLNMKKGNRIWPQMP